MTKSNHSKTLPIVAATISRFIEGGFGSAASGIVSAVMSGLPGVIAVAFIRLPAPSDIYSPKVRADIPRFRVVTGTLAHSREEAKTNHASRGQLTCTADFAAILTGIDLLFPAVIPCLLSLFYQAFIRSLSSALRH